MDTNVLLELAPILLVNFNQQVMVVLGMLLLGLPVLFAAENTKKKFNIPQGDAAETLQAFVEQSGEQIFFFVEHVRGYETRAVRGSFTSKEALTRMLEGSHLVFVTDVATGAVMVRKALGQESDSSIPDSEIPSLPEEPKQRKNKEETEMTPKNSNLIRVLSAVFTIGILGSEGRVNAQQEEEQVFELTPFNVQESEDVGYLATTTLAGTRLRTELRDVGTAVSVLTQEFLNDIGATDNVSALAYATNTEVGGLTGNYQNAPNTGSWGQTAETGFHFAPNTNTRVRGLVSADNTRNYFRTNVAWDGYNVSRIDLLRGPNSILFGLGSPGGVVNATTDSANVSKDSGQIQANFDEYGSFRGTLNYNKVIIQDQLAIRLALLSDNEEFQQRPAYDDEERLFLAGTWRPEGLNRNGITFDISLDYEAGEGTSNRPRTAPPLDWLTPWLEPVSTNPIQLPAGSNYMGFSNGVIPSYTQFVNRQGVTFLDNVSGNRPLGISGWADAFGPRLNVDPAVGTDYWRQGRVWVEGVLNPNGTVYFGNPQASRRLFGFGNAFQDSPLQAFDDYLIAQGHPLGNAFIPLQITDPTVFDFYNLLLDGPNKKEWNDFDQFRAVLSNTFFDQKVGYELSYFSENVTRNQTTYLSNAARIFVDTQLEDIEGNSNPDFGRPYVQETTFDGNRTLESEIEGFRASAYFELDFTESDNDSFWRRMVGRHLFNGAYSEDKTWAFNRNFQRHVLGPEFVEKSPNNPLYNNRTRVSVRYYLGDSIASSIGASGLNIPNMSRYVIPEGGTINLRWFDTTWNAPESVSPSAPWVNPLGQTWEQAANPDNYVGWSQGNYTIVDALSGDPDDLDLATRAASLQDNEVDSKIFTWQGFLVDGILVGTYGWREDESSSAIVTSGSNPVPYNNANLDPAVFNLDSSSASRNSLTVRSNSYSLVAHLNGLPWLGEKLPINVSLSYNEGENFNPTSGRRNVNGQFLGAPQGSTEEYGVLLSTKDNRYTLRVMQYETAVLNGPPTFSIANNFRFNQFLALNPRELVSDIESGEFRDLYNQQTTTPSFSIDDQENIHAPAWRQFERDLAAAFPGFVPTYLSTGTWAPSNTETSFSTGFANTEDNVSKGYEFEFTANPTDSLRITLNASKTKAERTNVPGESTESLYEFIQSKMYNTDGTPSAAGLMRSGYDPFGDTMANFWTSENYINYGVVRQLNGQLAPELVEWRVNLLANYNFTEGSLSGFGVGGAYRYESGANIGFPYYFDDNGTQTADLANGFERGSNDRYDLWLRYKSKLTDKVDWTIQLNIYNVLADDELIPVRANPDGTLANFRIQQGQSWRISNTFSF